VVGAVSPPGGDFSEPVTQYSLRLAGTFWALDADLARRRHFPSIHWTRSYSLYDLGSWFNGTVADDWEDQRRWALRLLGQEEELQNIVQLLGIEVLAPSERVAFQTGRMLREDFLQQSAYDEIDSFCPLTKQYWMLKVIRHLHEAILRVVGDETDLDRIAQLDVVADVARMRSWLPDDVVAEAKELMRRVDEEVATL